MNTVSLPLKISDKTSHEVTTGFVDMPIIAPHILTSWLIASGLLSFSESKAAEFWDHWRAVDAPWMRHRDFADKARARTFQPFGLYGDEVEYTESKEKLLLVFANYPLQEGPSTVWGTRFPLFCLRTERMVPDTMRSVWHFLAWSVNIMYTGVAPATGLNGEILEANTVVSPNEPLGYKCRLVEQRGDWKWHLQTMGLKQHWAANSLCHQCSASKVSQEFSYIQFVAEPRWLATVRTQEAFLLESLSLPPACSLIYTAGWHYSMVRWCSMHVVQLGVGLHTLGSGIRELLDVAHFSDGRPLAGSCAVAESFKRMTSKFKLFCRAHSLEHSQPPFKPYMLIQTAEDFCFLHAKATWPLSCILCLHCQSLLIVSDVQKLKCQY